MENLNKIPVTIIAAVSNNGFIGMEGNLPWKHIGVNLKGDLPRFKKTTIGNGNNAVIYGRLTGESMPFLDERYNCVLSRSENYVPPPNVHKFSSLNDAVRHCRSVEGMEEIFVIGGAKPFEEALRFADKMILTVTFDDYEGDVMFPPYNDMLWKVEDTHTFSEHRYKVIELYNLQPIIG